MDSPEELRILFHLCDTVSRERTVSQAELEEINVFFYGGICVIRRLGQIKTKDSAAALVLLLADGRLRWGGERGIEIGTAITSCGRIALPYLNELVSERKGRSARALEFRRYIENGEVLTY